MRFIIAIILLLSLTLIIDTYYFYSFQSSINGMFNLETLMQQSKTALALFIGTVSGVLSSVFITRASDKNKESKNFIESGEFIIACIISPVIVAGFYDKVAAIDSFWIVFILSHQNGYFWENISSVLRKTSK